MKIRKDEKTDFYKMALLLLAGYTFFCAAAPSFAEEEWTEINKKDGISIYSKKVPGSDILAFKGVTEIEVGIGRIIDIINDKSRHGEWVSRLVETKALSFISPLESIEYIRVKGRWPVSDRDLVFSSKAEIDEISRTVKISMHSVTDRSMPDQKGVIRGELMESTYLLQELDGGKTRIEASFYGDPKGWLPTWIINYFQKSWPYTTLINLRRQAARNDLEMHNYSSLAEYYVDTRDKGSQ